MTPITPQDVNKYIATIRINFENAYKTQNDEEREILIKSWYAILKDYPKEIVDKAVINAIKYAEFAPRIGSIVKEIEKMREAYEKSDSELWAELTTCVRKVQVYDYYRSQSYVYIDGEKVSPAEEISKLYKSLTPELREFVGGVAGLVSLSRQESLEYERGRFLKVVPTIKERTRTRSEMSENIAGLIQGLSAHLQIDCSENK